MNKDNLYSLLRSFREQDIICYAYRETAFNVLSTGKVDSTLYFITDAEGSVLGEVLKAKDFTDVVVKSENVEAKLGNQNAKFKIVNGEQENIFKAITQPLTINSLILREGGELHDKCGGLQDINDKILRRTVDPILDKSAFCTMCFELTLKRGFKPDRSVKDEMKKMVTLPLQKKISFLFSIRAVVKSGHFNVGYLLNALGYDGLFTNTGNISREKRSQLDTALRKTEPDILILFLCYLAGFKGEQLKSVNNLLCPKESYDKISKFFKDGGDYADIKKTFSEKEQPIANSFAELLSLISGTEYVIKSTKSNLFKIFDADEGWVKQTPEKTKNAESQEVSEQTVEKTEQTAPDEMQGMVGGEIEEKYEVDDDGESQPMPGASGYGVRNPTDNVFVSKNSK